MNTNEYRVVYENDEGYEGGFWEWWEVPNDKRTFKCYSKEDAIFLVDILNKEHSK
jgi:hypothetical protein